MEHLEIISLLKYGFILLRSPIVIFVYQRVPKLILVVRVCVYVCVRAMELPNTSI